MSTAAGAKGNLIPAKAGTSGGKGARDGLAEAPAFAGVTI